MNIDDLKIDIQGLCSKYGIKRLEVFGSFARGEARESSDIDLIAEFEGLNNLVDRYFGFKGELEDRTHRTVDLLPNKPFKNPYFAKNVARERKLIYG
jgi:predicted nucleotidyltransferase